jgi:predicted nuclease of restriction endonuclease-like (RecB) superfamily
LTESDKNVPQLVAQIPWGHTRLIIDKIKDITEIEFYIRQTIENSWSRSVLDHQIGLSLYKRQGKITNNFDTTISKQDVSILKESFKESYILDFLDIKKDVKERELEKLLTDNILKFILELGKGFAFVGKQFKLEVGGQEFFIDLLFYNYILNRFIVIELKNTDFKPEYVGQISFYLSAINKKIKTTKDKESIGLIICKGKNNKAVLEYSLENVKKPIGIAEYKIMAELGDRLKEVV